MALSKNKDLNPASGLFNSLQAEENRNAHSTDQEQAGNSRDREDHHFKFTMPKQTKKRRKKITSFYLYEDDAAEFLALAKELGYSGSDIINQFISDFIQANR